MLLKPASAVDETTYFANTCIKATIIDLQHLTRHKVRYIPEIDSRRG